MCGTVRTQEDPVKYVRWHAVYTAGDPWRRQGVCGPQEPDGERTPAASPQGETCSARSAEEAAGRSRHHRRELAAADITVGSRAPSPSPEDRPREPGGGRTGWGGALDVGAVCRGEDGALPGARRATAVGEKPCGDVTCTASASPAADAHQSQTPPLGPERRAASQPGVRVDTPLPRPAERPAPTCAAHPLASGARYLGVQWNPLLRGDSTGNCGRGHGHQSRGPDSAPSRA